MHSEKPDKKEMRKAKREQKKAEKKAIKKEKWKKLSFGQKVKKICIRLLILLLILLLVTGSGAATLVYFDVVDIPAISKVFDFFGIKNSKTEKAAAKKVEINKDEKSKELEELEKEIEKAEGEMEDASIDADSYFRNNSSVKAEIKVSDSSQVHTEKEAYDNMKSRGFGASSIETSYSMSGEYYAQKVISDTSSEKHPIYQTSYVCADESIWAIYEINGKIMAEPIPDKNSSGQDTQFILSESETITSYDSRTNKFYETIPYQITVMTVERIDAETIEKITNGEIDGL